MINKIWKNVKDGDKNINIYMYQKAKETKCEQSLHRVHTGLYIQNQVEETGSLVHEATETKYPCEIARGQLSVWNQGL